MNAVSSKSIRARVFQSIEFGLNQVIDKGEILKMQLKLRVRSDVSSQTIRIFRVSHSLLNWSSVLSGCERV